MVSVTMHREQKIPRSDAIRHESESKTPTNTSHEPSLKKVFICSPLRPVGETAEAREIDLKRNITLAKQACRYAVKQGYVPYAPHLYFPRFLSESNPDEREMGIIMGLTWLLRCDEVWVCGMRISEGMGSEIAQAKEWDKPLKAYIPVPGKGVRIFEADFLTTDEFYQSLTEH